MTATDHETSDASESEKQSEPENEDVKIRQHRISSKSKEEPGGGDNSDFVMVVNDNFAIGKNFGHHHQNVERQDDGASDAKKRELGEAEMPDKQHGQHEGEQEAGVAEELEGGNRTAKYLRAQRQTLTLLAIKTNSHRSLRFLNRRRCARPAGRRAGFGRRFRAADRIKPPDC